MLFLYRLCPDHILSTKQLRHALQLVVKKHLSLRTALNFDTQINLLMQRIISLNNDDDDDDDKQSFTFIESIFTTDEQLTHIIHNEKHNAHLFDLAQGLIFRCHLVYYQSISSNDMLRHNDVVIFNFHHAMFDVPSMTIFLDDLHHAYTTSQLTNDDDNTLRYLDCK